MKPVAALANRSFHVYGQTGTGKGIIGQNPLTKVVRGSEASNLHILLIVRPALQNRGYSLEREKTGKGELDDEKKERQGQEKERDGRERNERGWVLLKKEEKEELLSKGLKTIRRIKPRRNSFAAKGHRCTGFSPLSCGMDTCSVGCV